MQDLFTKGERTQIAFLMDALLKIPSRWKEFLRIVEDESEGQNVLMVVLDLRHKFMVSRRKQPADVLHKAAAAYISMAEPFKYAGTAYFDAYVPKVTTQRVNRDGVNEAYWRMSKKRANQAKKAFDKVTGQ